MSNDEPSNRALGSFPDANSELTWSNELKRGRVPGPRLAAHKTVDAAMGDSTKSVHAGTFEDPSVGPVTTPIFQTTTFLFSRETYAAFTQGNTRDFPIYTRYGNPSQWSVQEKVATLEGAESAVVFSSGMAAIFTVLLALTNRGGHIVSSRDVYGGTFNLLREDMHQIGRSVSFADPTSMASIIEQVRPETQLLFFETLTNPLLKAVPLRELVAFAKEHRLLLVLDNTFVSPIYLKPILEGVDIVIHSCTKYLNGHSDVVAGVASGSRKYMDRVWAQHLKVGGQLDPLICFLLERGLKTLGLRMRQAKASVTALVQMLVAHPKVVQAYHPEVPGYPYPWVHEYCRGGYGGMIGFQVAGGDEAALALLERLRIPAVATSLGGVESLVSLPFNTSHSVLTQAQREDVGIRPGLVRLSVGIEDTEDLVADLRQALDGLGE
jgi:cystathionine beta-lyase/cystathionine gamma-synthase